MPKLVYICLHCQCLRLQQQDDCTPSRCRCHCHPVRVQVFSSLSENPTPDLVHSKYISLSLIDLTQGRVNISAISVIRSHIVDRGRCIKGLEAKSGVWGCYDVLNQGWLIVFRMSLYCSLAMKLFLGLSSGGYSPFYYDIPDTIKQLAWQFRGGKKSRQM